MTDNLHYQDVFQTNIPKTEQDIRLQTTYLLAAAPSPSQGFEKSNEELGITNRSGRVFETYETSQAFWELRSTDGRVQRLLAITAYRRGGIVVGVDRRPSSEIPQAYRKSLHGFGYVYDSTPNSESFHGNGSEQEVQQFYDEFYGTVAALGLQQIAHLVVPAQNESSAAILASAA